jgi:diacylglycerol kinase (ATP)
VDQSTVAVILNPAAGAGKTLKLLPRVSAALQKLGRPYHLHVTTRPGEAPEVARQMAKAGAGVMIAVGGDGTINEVVNGIVTSGRQVPFGIVAGGHGSDFARTISVPTKVEDAIRRAASGIRRPIDLGRVTFEDGTSRLFINVAGLGFDADVADRAYYSRLPGGKLPYLAAVVGALLHFRNLEVTVAFDGQQVTQRAVFVTIANAKYFGGGLQITPMAAIDDGLLDLAIIGDLGKLELLGQVPNVYRGAHTNHPKFTHHQVRTVRIETASPARVQVDGELIGAAPATFSVEPAALCLAG